MSPTLADLLVDGWIELGVILTTADAAPMVRLDAVARRLLEVDDPGDIPIDVALRRVDPADRELVLARRAGFRADPPVERVEVELRVASADGGLRRVVTLGRLRPELRGQMGEVTVLVRDVTDRRRVDDELAALSTTLQAALGAMGDAVVISDSEGRFIHFNDSFATFHRFTSREDCATTLAEYLRFLDVYLPSGELAPLDQWAVPSALRGESATNAEFTLVRRDTGERWEGSYNYAPIRAASGAVLGSVVTARDVTELNRARRQRAEEDERRAYLNRLQDALSFLAEPREIAETAIRLLARRLGAAEAHYISVERDPDRLVPAYGYRPGLPDLPREIVLDGAHPTLDLVRDGTALAVEDVTTDLRVNPQSRALALQLGQRSFIVAPHRRSGALVGFAAVADGTVRHWSDQDQALVIDVVGRIAQALDRARWEAALQDSEARLASVIDTAADSIIVIDEHGVIVSANQATTTTFGYAADELVGRNVALLMNEGDAVRHDDYLAAYQLTGVASIIGIGREVQGRRRDGVEIPVDLAVTEWHDSQGHRYFTGILRDITERKRQEAALTVAHRLEAVGQLAGGVAHDFNNLLTVIGGNLEIAQSRITDEKTHQLVERAASAVRRGVTFNNRLLGLTQRRPMRAEPLNLATRLDELGHLIRPALGDAVTVDLHAVPELWNADLDPGELDSALLNLAANARTAMPDGGRLRIAATNTTLRPGTVSPVAVRAGDYVVLTITDTGSGMTPEVQARAIDPFFTTAPAGQGTGLGLASVARFVHDSGGFLTIDSAVGQGTTVSLHFPRSTAVRAEARTVAASEVGGRGRRILVVDDDELVLETTVATMESLGYDVVTAVNAAEAVSRLEADHGIDLVLTDVVMPGDLDGYGLAGRIRRERPGLPVVVCSGLTTGRTANGQDGIPFLAKPYSRSELARTLDAALDPPRVVASQRRPGLWSTGHQVMTVVAGLSDADS